MWLSEQLGEVATRRGVGETNHPGNECKNIVLRFKLHATAAPAFGLLWCRDAAADRRWFVRPGERVPPVRLSGIGMKDRGPDMTRKDFWKDVDVRHQL